MPHSRTHRFDHRHAGGSLFPVVRHDLNGIVDREADDDDRHERREGVRWTDHSKRAGAQPTFQADHPDNRQQQPHQREHQVGQRSQEQQNQHGNQQQRHANQRRHAVLSRLLVLILNDDRRHAADLKRPFVARGHLGDLAFGVGHPFVLGVA